MRILLCAINAKYIQTSLALRYLAAIGRTSSHQIERLEVSINDPLESIETAIARAAPDLLAFSCYVWNITQVLELADSAKKVQPGLIVLLGGPEVSFDAPDVLARNPAVDLIVAGEGEAAWTALLGALPNGDLDRVPSLYWRKDGAITRNPIAPPIPMSSLPVPYASVDGLGGRLVYYETARGCPYACAFCLSSVGGGVRHLEPTRVLDEMAIIAGSGATAVKFVDRTFNCRRDHAMAIWRGLLRHQGRTRFHFEIVADRLSEEELAFLSTVPPGLFQFEIGVQSTNRETLAAIGRQADHARLAANISRLRAAGNIHLHLDFIAGLPYEGYARFLESLDFGLKLGPDAVQLGFLKLLRGTRLRAEADGLGYVYRRRPPYEVLANPWLSFAELSRLKTMAGLIDSFFNGRRFTASLPVFFARAHSPAYFFAALAAYAEETGWHARARQTRDLPDFLWGFAECQGFADPVLRDRLRFDLHGLGRFEEPSWADAPRIPDLQTLWHDWLRVPANRCMLGREFAAVGPREVVRRARILAFAHDPTGPAAPAASPPALIALVYPEKGGENGTKAVKLDLCSVRSEGMQSATDG